MGESTLTLQTLGEAMMNQAPHIEKPLEHLDFNGATPWDRVKMANFMAARYSMDTELRKLAGEILQNTKNIPRDGGRTIAQWIRDNFQYLQESPGTEILQGPYSTLYSGVLDCDDAAILFATLARAAGIQAYFVGVGADGDRSELLHAVGYDASAGIVYELIDDRTYGNRWKNGLVFRLQPGYFGVYYAPEPGIEGYYVKEPGRPFEPVMEQPSNGENEMACYGCYNMGGKTPGKAPTVGDSSPGTGGAAAAGDGGGFWDDFTGLLGMGVDAGTSYMDMTAAEARAEAARHEAETASYADWAQPTVAAPDYSKYYLAGGLAAAGILFYLLMND